MARDGSGNFALPLSAVVADTTILASWANTTLDEVAVALTGSIARNGEATALADLPMNSFKHTGVAVAAALGQYSRVDEAIDGTYQKLTSPSGADTITATGPLAVAAYVAGQRFSFIAAAANTGAATLDINGIGVKSITKNGATALAANDILINSIVLVEYDGTQFQMIGGGGTFTQAMFTAQYVPATTVGIGFTSGDELVFKGTLPTGWTRSAFTNGAIRIVSDVTPGADQGTVDFDTAFVSQAVTGTNSGTAINITQMPAHTHPSSTHLSRGGATANGSSNKPRLSDGISGSDVAISLTINTQGGGGTHTHTLSGDAINLAVKYHDLNVITKT